MNHQCEIETRLCSTNLKTETQGNMTGAIAHYRSALHLEPAYPDGERCHHHQHHHHQHHHHHHHYRYHSDQSSAVMIQHLSGLAQLRIPSCYQKVTSSIETK